MRLSFVPVVPGCFKFSRLEAWTGKPVDRLAAALVTPGRGDPQVGRLNGGVRNGGVRNGGVRVLVVKDQRRTMKAVAGNITYVGYRVNIISKERGQVDAND